MRDVTVEHLRLRVPGLSSREAEELGRRLAVGLGRAPAGPLTAGHAERVSVRVADAGPDHLVDHLVAEILRELGRVL
jgi:hypothetical protein